jgi:glycosyltransferase involved in cell wall biosynthesis
LSRVLFVAYHFPPLGGGGVQRNLKFARYLPDFGYDPVVVTGPGKDENWWTPDDASMVAELPESVEVRRLAARAPERGARRARVERLLGLETPQARWWREGAVELGRSAGDVDLVYASLVPYAASAEAAAKLAAELGKPWVADLQDPWALDEMWLYPTELHRRRDLARMRRLLNLADAVVMNTPEAVVRVRRAFPELRDKLVVSIPNGFDEADFEGAVRERDDDAFRIVHTGYLYTDDGLRLRRVRKLRRVLGGMPVPEVDILTRSHVYLLDAVEKLLTEEPELAGTLEVHLVGSVSATDREIGSRLPVVSMPGYVTHAESLAAIRTADLLFLPMQDLPPGMRAGLVPGKTYEYLASGRPILAAVPDGDARELLESSGAAFLCRPADVDAMAALIRAEIERSRDGRPTWPRRAPVVDAYERRRLTQELASVFDRLVGRAARGPLAAASA